jgi:two-component system sensor histidine kinase AlgZ
MMASETQDRCWLPDLCNPLALLRLMLFAVLVTLVLILLRQGIAGFNLGNLGVLFFYAVWVVFVSSAGLCLLRRYFDELSILASASVAVLWLAVAATLCAIAGFWGLQYLLLDQQISLLALWVETLLTSVILGSLVLRFLFVHHQLQIQQQRLMQAQYDALQARIRPHFLFNSLNSIATLVGIDPGRAEEAILNLSDLLRATLGEEAAVTLKKELEVCQKYLDIEMLRMGERLRVEMDIDEQLYSLRLPPLCLQPLMENAVLHGLQKRPEGGCLNVKIGRDEAGSVCMLIENPLPDTPDNGSSGARSALINIRARLERFYPNNLDFEFGEKAGRYQVVIRIRNADV